MITKNEIIAEHLGKLPDPSDYEKREISGALNRRNIELFGFKSPIIETIENWEDKWQDQLWQMITSFKPRFEAIEALTNKYLRDAPSGTSRIKSARLNLRDGYVAIFSVADLERLGDEKVKGAKIIRLEVLHNPDAVENTILYN